MSYERSKLEFVEMNLMRQFPDGFEEMIRTNSSARITLDMLIHGESPYHCIYRLLQTNAEQFKTLCEVVNQSVPQKIVYDIRELKKWATQEQIQILLK